MRTPRRPSAEEIRLWRRAMRDTAPLRPPPADDTDIEIVSRESEIVSRESRPSPPATVPMALPVPAREPGPGLDKASRDRLRRGQYPIDGTLDLHGMNRERAHAAVTRFLLDGVARDWRCLLLVTGKGKGGELGVLKGELPRWLAEPPLRALILATVSARPQHGGDGAVYLLLRRRRP